MAFDYKKECKKFTLPSAGQKSRRKQKLVKKAPVPTRQKGISDLSRTGAIVMYVSLF